MESIFFITSSFVASILFFIFFDFICPVINLMDEPDNDRKIHKKKIPLLGGLLIFFNFFIFVFFYFFSENLNFNINLREMTSLIVGSTLIFILGVYDDKYNVNHNTKLILLSFIILIALKTDDSLIISQLDFSFTEKSLELRSFSLIFSFLCILILINALNMFDGLNGQCGSYALFLIILLSVLSSYYLALIPLIISLIIFNLLNLLNKTFLGNSGSHLLGFLLSYYIIKFYNTDKFFNADQIFILLIIPGLDMIRLIFKRLLNNKNPFKGDKNHIHHLILKKYSPFITFVIIQIICFLPIMLFYVTNSFLISFFSSIAIYTFIIFYFDKKYENINY